MEYPIPRIIEYFSDASIQFVDLTKTTITAAHQSTTGYTSTNYSELIITLSGCAAVTISNFPRRDICLSDVYITFYHSIRT